MERLTEWYDDGEHKGVMVKEARGEHVLKTLFDELDEGYLGMCELKAYEDTDLTPEQIMELKERDTAKPTRPIRDRSLYAICLNCGQTIFRDHRFCPDCGQRLKHKEERRWNENLKRH